MLLGFGLAFSTRVATTLGKLPCELVTVFNIFTAVYYVAVGGWIIYIRRRYLSGRRFDKKPLMRSSAQRFVWFACSGCAFLYHLYLAELKFVDAAQTGRCGECGVCLTTGLVSLSIVWFVGTGTWCFGLVSSLLENRWERLIGVVSAGVGVLLMIEPALNIDSFRNLVQRMQSETDRSVLPVSVNGTESAAPVDLVSNLTSTMAMAFVRPFAVAFFMGLAWAVALAPRYGTKEAALQLAVAKPYKPHSGGSGPEHHATGGSGSGSGPTTDSDLEFAAAVNAAHAYPRRSTLSSIPPPPPPPTSRPTVVNPVSPDNDLMSSIKDFWLVFGSAAAAILVSLDWIERNEQDNSGWPKVLPPLPPVGFNSSD
jgi:hypothetical protein